METPPEYLAPEIDGNDVPRERNGFVSFWLWLCLVINVLFAIGYFALLFSDRGLFARQPEPIAIRLAWFALSLALVYGYWSLLKWRKLGWTILCAVAVLNSIVNIATTGPAGFLSLLPLLILYLILQIRKNGISCWSWLE